MGWFADVVFVLFLWVVLVVVGERMGLCIADRGVACRTGHCGGWAMRAEVWVGRLSRWCDTGVTYYYWW